jgi:hypothetical protein
MTTHRQALDSVLETVGETPLVRVHATNEVLPGGIVGWSGFMPATGAMAHQPLWPRGWIMPTPDETAVRERAAWHGFGTGHPIPGADD